MAYLMDLMPDNVAMIVRLLIYIAALVLVIRKVWIVERPEGNGGKMGLRFLLIPLAFSQLIYVIAVFTKLCDLDSIYTSWWFCLSSVVTIICMLLFGRWLNTPRELK